MNPEAVVTAEEIHFLLTMMGQDGYRKQNPKRGRGHNEKCGALKVENRG